MRHETQSEYYQKLLQSKFMNGTNFTSESF